MWLKKKERKPTTAIINVCVSSGEGVTSHETGKKLYVIKSWTAKQ